MRFNLRLFAATAAFGAFAAFAAFTGAQADPALLGFALQRDDAAITDAAITKVHYRHRYYDEDPFEGNGLLDIPGKLLGGVADLIGGVLGATYYGDPYVRPVYASEYYGGPHRSARYRDGSYYASSYGPDGGYRERRRYSYRRIYGDDGYYERGHYERDYERWRRYYSRDYSDRRYDGDRRYSTYRRYDSWRKYDYDPYYGRRYSSYSSYRDPQTYRERYYSYPSYYSSGYGNSYPYSYGGGYTRSYPSYAGGYENPPAPYYGRYGYDD
jgi:hypothetical protein